MSIYNHSSPNKNPNAEFWVEIMLCFEPLQRIYVWKS
jgi:hypothetical protein